MPEFILLHVCPSVVTEMQLSVTGRHIDIGDALRGHIDENLPATVTKYFGRPTDAQVTVSKEGHTFKVDIQVHVTRRLMVQGMGSAQDAYGAFDEALGHVGKRLRRYKRRIKEDKPHAEPDILPAQQYVLAATPDDDDESVEAGDQPVIIAEMEHGIETMSVGDAVMRMDLSGVPALMFRNSKHGGLNMVYVRPDGNIGWVDPRISGDGKSGG